MLIVSLELRNYRVFESLDLEFPPGVVGIYGANGAGKSTLLESILWVLYGKARTQKGDIRSTAATGECSAELRFEHDGHHYRARRSISGQNATVKARLWIGEQVAADGPTEVERFVHSLLGMDHSAFRASVFAEQKQLAAFSDQSPERRRQLVLQLLGITPLEKARDNARADARQCQADHQRMVALLPELGRLEQRASDAASAAVEAESAASTARRHADAGEAALAAVVASLATMEEARVRHDLVRQRGGAVRDRRDRAAAELRRITDELLQLDQDHRRHGELQDLAASREELELRLTPLRAYDAARRELDSLPPLPVLITPDPAPVAQARADVEIAGSDLAVLQAQVRQARSDLDAAELAVQHMATLNDSAACPLCGQELGPGFATAHEHRQDELSRARSIHEAAQRLVPSAVTRAAEARTLLAVRETVLRQAEEAARAAAAIGASRQSAQRALAESISALGHVPTEASRAVFEAQLSDARAAATDAARLQGRLEGEAALRNRQRDEQAVVEAAEAERQDLLDQLKAISFVASAHAELSEQRTALDATVARGRAAATAAERAAAGATAADAALGDQLREARERHAQLGDLADDARHLARTADLLQGFRHVLVGLIGPRLSIQAGELFNDLTGHDYDGLEVDPETYELRISHRGTSYTTNRFSGSEIDLANLALRVAISEQVRFQAGGQVGLLVLDEALASLDADRKDRMLSALTRLGGRFRQILVVTHAPEVKEQLPQAIEVVKLGSGRSTARVVEPAW